MCNTETENKDVALAAIMLDQSSLANKMDMVSSS